MFKMPLFTSKILLYLVFPYIPIIKDATVNVRTARADRSIKNIYLVVYELKLCTLMARNLNSVSMKIQIYSVHRNQALRITILFILIVWLNEYRGKQDVIYAK